MADSPGCGGGASGDRGVNPNPDEGATLSSLDDLLSLDREGSALALAYERDIAAAMDRCTAAGLWASSACHGPHHTKPWLLRRLHLVGLLEIYALDDSCRCGLGQSDALKLPPSSHMYMPMVIVLVGAADAECRRRNRRVDLNMVDV